MATKKTSFNTPTDAQKRAAAATPLTLPVTPPRNRIATNPLLKKSGAHADRRLKESLDHANAEMIQARTRKRKFEDD